MKHLEIDTIFPTVVGRAQTKVFDELVEHCESIYQTVPKGGYGWINSTTYNTAGTYSILKDSAFEEVNALVESAVNVFAKELHYSDYYPLKEGMMVLYEKGNSQEYHYHSGYTFTAVYYLTTPEGSSDIYLQAPSEPDMINPNISEWDELNSMVRNYPVEAGQIVIFRSFIQHCVPPHQSDEHRIALVYEL